MRKVSLTFNEWFSWSPDILTVLKLDNSTQYNTKCLEINIKNKYTTCETLLLLICSEVFTSYNITSNIVHEFKKLLNYCVIIPSTNNPT